MDNLVIWIFLEYDDGDDEPVSLKPHKRKTDDDNSSESRLVFLFS